MRQTTLQLGLLLRRAGSVPGLVSVADVAGILISELSPANCQQRRNLNEQHDTWEAQRTKKRLALFLLLFSLTCHGERRVAAPRLTGAVAGHAPVRAGVAASTGAAAPAAPLRHSQEEEGAFGQDEPVAALLEHLALAVPRHLRLGLALRGAAQRGRLVAQHGHVHGVLDDPGRERPLPAANSWQQERLISIVVSLGAVGPGRHDNPSNEQ